MEEDIKKYHVLVEILKSAGLEFENSNVGDYWLGENGFTVVDRENVPAILFDIPGTQNDGITNNYMISISQDTELIISKREVDYAGMVDLRLPIFCEDLHDPDSIDKAISLIERIRNGEKAEYRQKRKNDR